MSFVEIAAYVLLFFVIVAGVSTLTSRTAITRLTEMGLLPRAFVHFVPALTLAARTAAIVLILVGLARLAYVAGWLSPLWIERYGLAALLLVLGGTLLVLTWRKSRA